MQAHPATVAWRLREHNAHYPWAVVWIDHQEARILRFDETAGDRTMIRSRCGHKHTFLQSVAESMRGAQSVLIVGPSMSKHELLSHVERSEPIMWKRVVGVEAVDHPTDEELLVYAQQHFRVKSGLHVGV
ncbi:MAG: hypothetical protein ABIT36_07215 [Steroidobacteraceae bacterium]